MPDDIRTTDPPVSEAQRKAMWAAASGKSNIGIPKSVGREFAEADPGGKLPEKAKDMTNPKDGGPQRKGTVKLPEVNWSETKQKQPPTKKSTQPSSSHQLLPEVNWSRDVTEPKPASGPMSTGGDVGTSEGLPKTTEPFKQTHDTVGKAMSLDDIKATGKRIGRY